MRVFRDVRMRGFRDRADPEELLQTLLARTTPGPAESVELSSAASRVLVADILARVDVPPFHRAAMDGFAVRGEETFGATPAAGLPMAVLGEARPGHPWEGTVGQGQALRVMTGAPLPRGADAVVPAEGAQETSGGQVLIQEAVPPGRHVQAQGEDVRAGALLLPAGRRLRPQDLGVLACQGVVQVDVHRQPRVICLCTGDELVPAGTPPGPGQIPDSNSVMLLALVERDGARMRERRILPDDRETQRQALAAAAAEADLVLVTGGTSVGLEDHGPGLLAEMGELVAHGVAMRPASPTGVGYLQEGRVPVFLIPGSPVACLAAYDVLAGPVLRRLGGLPEAWPCSTVRAPVARKIVSEAGRLDYVRVRLEEGGVVPVAASGAAILSSTVVATGVVLVPRDREGYGEGDQVTVHLYSVPA